MKKKIVYELPEPEIPVESVKTLIIQQGEVMIGTNKQTYHSFFVTRDGKGWMLGHSQSSINSFETRYMSLADLVKDNPDLEFYIV